MNLAPIFTVCAASAAFKAVFGSSPVRLYPAGRAPQGVALPYASWQVISGEPLNYLDEVPSDDDYRLQVDVYAASYDAAFNGAQLLAATIQEEAYVLNYNSDGVDKDTENSFYSFDVGWIVTG